MNVRFLNSPSMLCRLLVLALLCAWCVSHAAALTHSHDADSLQDHCTMCAVAALDDLVPTASLDGAVPVVLPYCPTWAKRPAPRVAPVRLYSPRAPPA